MGHKCSFDLSQLDAKPPNLYLIVKTTETLDISVRPEATKIASLVQPRRLAGGQRIGHESFPRQLVSVQVPAGHPVAANIDLSYNIGGHRIQMRIQDVNLRVRNRPTDRY